MRRLSICFLVLTSLVAIGFLSKAGYKVSQYFSLDKTSNALTLDFDISEKAPSSFSLGAFYSFKTEEKGVITGYTELSKPYFLNLPSAKFAVEEFKKKSWDVFYNQSNPSKNSLQKNFPFKDCIQAILTLGVFVYFLFFRKIVEKATQEW